MAVMSGGFIGAMWRHIHSLLDKPFRGLQNLRIIEVGSGNGQHFSLTTLDCSLYLEVDKREQISIKIDLEKESRLNRKFLLGDATTLSEIPNNTFNGLISTCLLAHLSESRVALENWRRVVANSGVLMIYVPNEPGLLLRLVRRFSTKRRIAKLGYDHDYLHWSEHRNHYPGMRMEIRNVFKFDEIKETGFPFNSRIWDLNLFTIFKIVIRK